MPDIKVHPGFTSSTYDEDLNIATVNDSNAPFRVKMSEVLESMGVIGHPLATGWQFPANFRFKINGSLHIAPSYRVEPYLEVNSTLGIIYLHADNHIRFLANYVRAEARNTVAGQSFVIENAAGAPTRIGIADAWTIYPSFAEDKEDLIPIEDPLDKSTQIRGYNYTQGGKQKSGFTIEDVQANHPEALTLNEKQEVTGYDPNCLLALLFESNRLLEERVSDLEARQV